MLIERANQTLRRLRPDPAPRPSRAFRCAVAAAGLVSLVYLACVALRAGGFAASITVDDVGPLIAAGLAAILCLRTARGHAGRPRAGWALFGSAAASWAIGETLWTWFEVIRGIPAPFPSAADAAFLLSVPLTIAGLLCFYAPPLGITSRLRTVLDALIIAASTLLVSWLTVLESVFRGAGGGLLARSISLAYPVGDVITLSVLLVVARRRPAGPRLPLGWLAAAVLALSISDSAFTYFSAIGRYDASRLFDTGWTAGFLLLGLAALHPARPGPGDDRPERVLLPYVPVTAALVLLLGDLVTGARIPLFAQDCAVALAAFVVVRQLLTLRENHLLTDDLEARIRMRTLELHHSEQRLRTLLRNVSDVISVVQCDATIAYLNPAVRHVLGYAEAELLGHRLFELVHPDDEPEVVGFLAGSGQVGVGSRRLECRMRHRDGSWRHTETSVSDLCDELDAGRFVLTTRDVTERRELEQQLIHQAFHDPLTDLANRSLFSDRVGHALTRTRRNGSPIAVAFIDLDDFKIVNDTLGHGTGDLLLIEVARRLAECVRYGDTVARLGGDEFAVLMEDCDEPAALAATARFEAALSTSVSLEGTDLDLSASVGIAMGGSRTGSVAELLRNADIAMYGAKADGKAGHRMFRDEMHHALLLRAGLQSDLRRALAHDEFELAFQPLVDLSTCEVKGFEALLRWNHPQRGRIAPLDFIPLAEDSGLIIPIGAWVLRTALAQVARWSRAAGSPLGVNVNVSGRQLMSQGFAATVASALAESGVDPGLLTLELTESVLLKDADGTVARMRALKSLGVQLAIDDFGTGFSSLAYLQRFPVDSLKIDKSFVDQISTTERARELVRSVISLGAALNLHTVAEGIEHAAQADQLRLAGCTTGQGYLYAEPLSAIQAGALLRDGVAVPDAS